MESEESTSLSNPSDRPNPPIPSIRPDQCVAISPGKQVRAEFAVETIWSGTTVYPACAVLRVWQDDRPVLHAMRIGLQTATGERLACGLSLRSVTRHRAQTPLGPGRELRIRLADRLDRKLAIRIRITDRSVFCEVVQPYKRCQTGTAHFDLDPAPMTCLTSTDTPSVYYVPAGKLVASWKTRSALHAVFFDRPGDLVPCRFNVLPTIGHLPIADGKAGCDALFLMLPFTKSALPNPTFSDLPTPLFKIACTQMFLRQEGADDFWLMRGEPGVFAIAARRRQRTWDVFGITAEPRTVTVRFEDLWLRMPPELRAARYAIHLSRDPLKEESGPFIEEHFAHQPPDIRVVLDLAANGGFRITFKEEEE